MLAARALQLATQKFDPSTSTDLDVRAIVLGLEPQDPKKPASLVEFDVAAFRVVAARIRTPTNHVMTGWVIVR